MKLLITSPDALYNFKTDEYFDGIEEALDGFLAQDPSNAIVTISHNTEKLAKIDARFSPQKVSPSQRGSGDIVESIRKDHIASPDEVIILAGNKADFRQSFNSKLLLLSANYARINEPDCEFFGKHYGIQINSGAGLDLYFNRLMGLSEPWFYKIDIPPITTMYALTDAMTFTKRDTSLATKFRQVLKVGSASLRVPFLNYFMASLYKIFQEVKTIDLWCVYPSSDGSPNGDLEFFKEQARLLTKKKITDRVFIRHKRAKNRHKEMSRDERIISGCDTQLDTIHLNPKLKSKIKGATICVIDDFSTNGTSCETARVLLTEAKAARIIFIAMGKFSQNYYQYRYRIHGDVFGSFNFEQTGRKLLKGTINASSDKEFMESLNGLV